MRRREFLSWLGGGAAALLVGFGLKRPTAVKPEIVYLDRDGRITATEINDRWNQVRSGEVYGRGPLDHRMEDLKALHEFQLQILRDTDPGKLSELYMDGIGATWTADAEL